MRKDPIGLRYHVRTALCRCAVKFCRRSITLVNKMLTVYPVVKKNKASRQVGRKPICNLF